MTIEELRDEEDKLRSEFIRMLFDKQITADLMCKIAEYGAVQLAIGAEYGHNKI